MPATEFSGFFKETCVPNRPGQPVTAGLEVRSAWGRHGAEEARHVFPHGSLAGHGLQHSWLPGAPVFKGLRAGHLPSSCSCLYQRLESIPLFPWETRGCVGEAPRGPCHLPSYLEGWLSLGRRVWAAPTWVSLCFPSGQPGPSHHRVVPGNPACFEKDTFQGV